MNQACPISRTQVNARAARVSGTIVVVAGAVVLATGWYWLLAPLAVDFGVKAALGLRRSPLCKVCTAITRALQIRPKMEDEAPKRFAAGVGFVCSVGAASAWYGGAPLLAQAVLSTFLVCAFLEAAFGVCVGCRVYGLLLPLLNRERPAEEVPSTV